MTLQEIVRHISYDSSSFDAMNAARRTFDLLGEHMRALTPEAT